MAPRSLGFGLMGERGKPGLFIVSGLLGAAVMVLLVAHWQGEAELHALLFGDEPVHSETLMTAIDQAAERTREQIFWVSAGVALLCLYVVGAATLHGDRATRIVLALCSPLFGLAAAHLLVESNLFSELEHSSDVCKFPKAQRTAALGSMGLSMTVGLSCLVRIRSDGGGYSPGRAPVGRWSRLSALGLLAVGITVFSSSWPRRATANQASRLCREFGDDYFALAAVPQHWTAARTTSPFEGVPSSAQACRSAAYDGGYVGPWLWIGEWGGVTAGADEPERDWITPRELGRAVKEDNPWSDPLPIVLVEPDRRAPIEGFRPYVPALLGWGVEHVLIVGHVETRLEIPSVGLWREHWRCGAAIVPLEQLLTTQAKTWGELGVYE